MFTKNIKDQFSADLLNTVQSVLDEAKKCKECGCAKCECEDNEQEEMDEGKRGLWDNIHAKRARIKAGSGERMRKPGSKGAPTDADFKAAAESVDVNEDFEELDELSKKTLGSYIKKATGDVGKESLIAGLKVKSGENATKNLNKSLSRQAGIASAAKKLTKEEQDFIDSLNDETFTEIDEAEKNLTGLPKSTAEKNKQYIEITHLLGHKKRVPVHPSNAYKALNRYRNDPTTKSARIVSEEAEQIDELSKQTLGSYVNKALDSGVKTMQTQQKRKWASDVNADQKTIDKRVRGLKLAKNKLAKEEAEPLDELSKGLLRRTGGKMLRKGLGDGPKAEKHMKSANLASAKLYPDQYKNSPLKAKVVATEETELDEARGRPPKEGSAAWHARQNKADDDMVALGMQLRKAKSMNKKVRFMNGKEHEVSAYHADRFEDHMAARKTTNDKAAFQKQAHKSHEDFVKAVSAPVPKAAKDTGEIVKYRH